MQVCYAPRDKHIPRNGTHCHSAGGVHNLETCIFIYSTLKASSKTSENTKLTFLLYASVFEWTFENL
jgi:hypothetical protein